MRFYTNVVQWGNQILVREYKNGERLNHKVKYSPTLYVPVQKETGWKKRCVVRACDWLRNVMCVLNTDSRD